MARMVPALLNKAGYPNEEALSPIENNRSTLTAKILEFLRDIFEVSSAL
jgi:hypothetical protein